MGFTHATHTKGFGAVCPYGFRFVWQAAATPNDARRAGGANIPSCRGPPSAQIVCNFTGRGSELGGFADCLHCVFHCCEVFVVR